MKSVYICIALVISICSIGGCNQSSKEILHSPQDAYTLLRDTTGVQQTQETYPYVNYVLMLETPEKSREYMIKSSLSGYRLTQDRMSYDYNMIHVEMTDAIQEKAIISGEQERIITPETVYMRIHNILLTGPVETMQIPIAQHMLLGLQNKWITIEKNYDFGVFTKMIPFEKIASLPYTIYKSLQKFPIFDVTDTIHDTPKESFRKMLFPVQRTQYMLAINTKQLYALIQTIVPSIPSLIETKSPVQRSGYMYVEGDHIELYIKQLDMPLYNIYCTGLVANTTESSLYCTNLSGTSTCALQWTYANGKFSTHIDRKDPMIDVSWNGTIQANTTQDIQAYEWKGEGNIQTSLFSKEKSIPYIIQALVQTHTQTSSTIPLLPLETEQLFTIIAPLTGN